MDKNKKIIFNLFLLLFFSNFIFSKIETLRELIEISPTPLFQIIEDHGIEAFKQDIKDLIMDIEKFYSKKQSSLSLDNLWLFSPPENKNIWLNPLDWTINDCSCESTNKFCVVAEKLIVEPNSEIVFVGDLHGSWPSLISFFNVLRELGYLDENYKICKDNVYFVFLGDYVGRNYHFNCLKTLWLIVNFFNENSGKVYLLRGNHETFKLSDSFDFAWFLDNLSIFSACSPYSICFDKVHCLFDYLPFVLYLGCKDENGITHFLQCCHGGIEIGYDPKDLLDNDGLCRYQYISQLRRKDFIETMQTNRSDIYFSQEDFSCGKILVENLSCLNSFRCSQSHISLGFSWADFDYENTCEGLSYHKQRSYCCGEKFTRYYLSKSSTEKSKLCGFIRGHQHGEKMCEIFLEKNGFADLWGGLVYTLLSSPLYKNLSFVILTMTEDKRDWRLNHFYRIQSEDFATLHRRVFNYFQS